ncbi:MAG: aminoacyl-tRNA hydrolase [Candidatus Acidiferrales bacterium]
MRLIVGLGNPGPEYARTPHNLGFAVVERLAALARVRSHQHRDRSLICRGRLDQTEVLLAKPQTYMNLSGPAVAALLRSEGLKPADLIVVSDEVALPWGMVRVRERGSAGGHRGLESVVAALGTEDFIRVRLGAEPPDGRTEDLADYVTQPVPEEWLPEAQRMVEDAAEAVRVILREGTGRAMARFNRRASAAPPVT